MSERSASPLPLVSVVIPAYNYGHFVAETLASIQAQTYQQWECIVVDDGSTDNTGAVVSDFVETDQRIKYIRQNNSGLAAARNAGIALSSGEYFQFLDADDLIERQKFARQVELLEKDPAFDIVFADARYFRSNNLHERLFSQEDENLPWVPKLSAKGDDVLLPLMKNNIMVVNAPLIRRAVIEEVGLFDGSVKGIEDWHYWIRCAIAGKHFHYDDSEETRALVRIHTNSMSTDARLMIKSTLVMHRKFARVVSEPRILRVNQERMVEREGLLGIEEVAAGKLLTGIRQLCKTATMSQRTRLRAKWLFCAASAPFVSPQRLRKMVTVPVGRSLMSLINS